MVRLLASASIIVLAVACGGGGDSDRPPDDAPSVDAPPTENACRGRAARSNGPCDVLTQAGCDANERCTWIVELRDDPATAEVEPDVGRMGCACGGSIAVGEACVVSGPAFPASEFPQMGMGAGVADECVKGAYCRDVLDGLGLCKEICDVNPSGVGDACDESFVCTRIESTFLAGAAVVAGVCEPTCDPVTQRTIASGQEACGSPAPDDPYIGCFPQGPATAPDNFACARVPREAKGKKDGDPAYVPPDRPSQQTGTYSNGCEAGYRAAYFIEGSASIAECHGTCAPKDTDHTMQSGATGDPAALASDCRYQWFLDLDTEGVLLGETQFSDTTGVCFPYSRLQIDPDGAAGPMAPVPYPSCAQMARYDEPPVAPFDFTAADAGCYSLAFTSTLPEETRQRIQRNAAKLPRLHFPKAEGRTVARHLLR